MLLSYALQTKSLYDVAAIRRPGGKRGIEAKDDQPVVQVQRTRQPRLPDSECLSAIRAAYRAGRRRGRHRLAVQCNCRDKMTPGSPAIEQRGRRRWQQHWNAAYHIPFIIETARNKARLKEELYVLPLHIHEQ